MQAVRADSEQRHHRLQRILAGLMAAFGLAAGGLIAVDPLATGRFYWLTLALCFVGLTAAVTILSRAERRQLSVREALNAHIDTTMHDLRRRDRASRTASAADSHADSAARLRQAYMRTLESLTHPLGAETSYDAVHGEHVASLAQRIALHMKLPTAAVERLGRYGPFLDHGKFAVAARILQKEQPLETWELTIARRHVDLSVALLEPLEPGDAVLAMIRHHHERWDGKGYPDCLKGEEIPIDARVLAVADAYHAIINPRPYAAARSLSQAIAEIDAHTGTQFDPAAVAALKAVLTPTEIAAPA